MADFTKKVKDFLDRYGCYYLRRGKGDHDIWWSPITNRIVPPFCCPACQKRPAAVDLLPVLNYKS